MILIDGSHGEGGGQMLRTALSLSCVTGSPFCLSNIRKNRAKPGLMPQHLTCIHAAQLIAGAHVTGASRASMEIVFEPGESEAGSYSFDIGTAGSTSLLLQAMLPPLVAASSASTITLAGGTHVMTSPVYQYIEKVFIPLLDTMGIKVVSRIERYGFYPKGGGKIVCGCTPSPKLENIELRERGLVKSVKGLSVVSGLPVSIANRQRDAAYRVLRQISGLDISIDVQTVSSAGPGTFLFVWPEGERVHAGFSSLGAPGKPAEKVGEEAAVECLGFLKGRACLDSHLADQITLYCALSEQESVFTTSGISQHLLTNLWVIRRFLDGDYDIKEEPDAAGTVTIRPKGAKNEVRTARYPAPGE